jgi:2-oxoglutarate/2-oxoacid ferredoxin oxidoreductase subunit alpha
MRLSVLIGGKAGQGINKVSQIISQVLTKHGYYIFNYRDYPSLIRGGHNFNVLNISDKQISSHESKINCILAMDDNTIKLHKKELTKKGLIIDYKEFKDLGRNINIALAGAFIKTLGIDKKYLIDEIKKEFNTKETIQAAEKGYNSEKELFHLKKLKNKIKVMSGSQAVATGSINSKIDRYIAYPMTPATGVMHVLAANQKKNNFIVFQPENEIAVVNAALGSSFTGKRTMIGTSGGGFDLMTEGLSLQGMTEIPLVVYLAARPGPGTGTPTYTIQGDINIALRGGHGEFPRIVVIPGDPNEAIEKTNEAFYLSEKFNSLSIVLSDKHLAESEFSVRGKPNKTIIPKINRNIPGKTIVKASGYEHDKFGNTTEDATLLKRNAEARIIKYQKIKKEAKRFEMIKIHGKKNSKNLIIGCGSTKGAILDAIEGKDFKFLQVLYLMPISDEIRKEIKKAKKVILVENNLTGQLGRLIREKTGIKIKNRILKYDGRPFLSDELRRELK